ncbi:MAG: polysaccharide deacetylase family protein [Actinomycetota bacterium]|nr:polysaccharide deacetylase family protein [Actinomycetota bacterium]MDQ2982874.1 polysaccharide deacetylase family protein [Actinomycetota bacterium]
MEGRPPLLLSIDFEDWHQLVHRRLGLSDWDRPYAALERQTAVVLDLLDELDARATFFLLGMSAVNHPELAQEIVRRGHEPACHGFAHTRVYDQTREEFRADLERSVEVIADATGRRPVAYRAPAFSINRRTPWAYDVLAETGFRYDSSQYDSPRIRERIGGIPESPYRLELSGGAELWELPVAVWGSVPVGGGAYWRVLPPRVLDRALDGVRRRTAYPVLYFHPYEFDPKPLKAALPPSPSARQRLVSTTRSLWRNTGRQLVARRLREVARRYELLGYEQAYDDIQRLYGARTRALSEEGVLV